MKNFEFKIYLLELVGEMYTGVALIMIVNGIESEKSYEALLWLSPDIENIKDRFIMPSDFSEEYKLDYKEFIKRSFDVLPNREEIFKEAKK